MNDGKIRPFETSRLQRQKIGKALREKPFGDTPDFIDLELWRMIDPGKNQKVIDELKQAYFDPGRFRITDKLISKTFVLLRVKLTASIFNEIVELKEIARADRPSIPQFNPFEYSRPDVSNMDFREPDETSQGVLIVDSGIVSNHPMLEKCTGGEGNFQEIETQLQDSVGHGTAVAGCVAYGDVRKSIESADFAPSNWIFSAKVMYGEKNEITGEIFAVFDPEKLFEHRLKDAVESFLSHEEYHIRAVNISLGNKNEVWHKNYARQLPLAALIDELAFEFPDAVFIVAAGNQHPANIFDSIEEIVSNYPSYFETPDFNIINPATASLALTVGSIAGELRIEQERFGSERIKTPIALENQPSPFTRTGFGINGMIKPELVEYGGNLVLFDNYGRIAEDRKGKIALLNNRTTDDIVKFDRGTSFSAAKVSHLAGKIANRFPQRSGNFLKNMLLIGADYPFEPDNDFIGTSNTKKAQTAHLATCGYGLSDFEKAVNSLDNRVVLWDEGRIGLNRIKVYSLRLPDIFFSEKGRKKITVVLVFNPETRLTRGDSYLGNRMEFHLFHSVNPQILMERYGIMTNQGDGEEVPKDLKKFEIDFFPGSNTRKAGCHQKAWKEYKREPKNIPATPISLVLLNIDKWIGDENRLQDYCLSVTFEHEKEIGLYNELRANIQARVRV